jgi:molybdenum cofactor cytidylyltransferase
VTRRLAIIVLAAGRATRFAGRGEHKLLAPVDGVPLVRRSVRSACDAATGDVVVVTGCDATRVEHALHGLAVRFVHAADFANGMAASLRAGIEAVHEAADAAMIALGDQPFVRPEAYRRIADAWRSTGAAIVVPRYRDARYPAHPVLFAAETFAELLALEGDVGARTVVSADPGRVAMVDLEWPAPRDIDTPDDLAAAVADVHPSDPDPQSPTMPAAAVANERDTARGT